MSHMPDEQFASRCAALITIADINRSAVCACVELLQDTPGDEEAGRMAAQSVAFGIAQLFSFRSALLLLAIDSEMPAAPQVGGAGQVS